MIEKKEAAACSSNQPDRIKPPLRPSKGCSVSQLARHEVNYQRDVHTTRVVSAILQINAIGATAAPETASSSFLTHLQLIKD